MATMKEESIRTRQLTWGDIVLIVQAIFVVGGGFYFFGSLGKEISHLSNAVTELNVRLEAFQTFRIEIVRQIGKLEGMVETNTKRLEKLESNK